VCGKKNYGGETENLFELEIGSDYTTHSICLCRACAIDLAGKISYEFFDNGKQEGEKP
jgi:hypothetical protein